MILTSKPFIGGNYANLGNSAWMGLGAKLKLEFVNCIVDKANKGYAILHNWITSDDMVRCWILNSLATRFQNALCISNLAKSCGMS